jgi:cytochrome c5
MSAADDRRFLDWFMRAVGVLAGFLAGMVLFVSYEANSAAPGPGKDDPGYQQQVAGRIAPLASVAVAGKDNGVRQPDATAPAAPAPAAPPAVLTGEQVYTTTCSACHGAGVAGAPKFADKAAWAPRLLQGAAVLHKHALEGFQGKSGVMPAKGGRIDLADQSIVNGVDYMVNAAR